MMRRFASGVYMRVALVSLAFDVGGGVYLRAPFNRVNVWYDEIFATTIFCEFANLRLIISQWIRINDRADRIIFL